MQGNPSIRERCRAKPRSAALAITGKREKGRLAGSRTNQRKKNLLTASYGRGAGRKLYPSRSGGRREGLKVHRPKKLQQPEIDFDGRDARDGFPVFHARFE